MREHTYLIISENKNSTMLCHTSHIAPDPWMFENVKILKVLTTNNYNKAQAQYEKFLKKNKR